MSGSKSRLLPSFKAALSAILFAAISAPPAKAEDCVVLLHGLARTSRSMSTLGAALETVGYRVVNVDYPSRDFSVEQLSPMAVERGIGECRLVRGEQVHFVTHSMGGILIRYYLEHHELEAIGKVVMLAPPNQGSEIVDHLKDLPGFSLLNGPAGMQLGTTVGSIPSQLGAVTVPVGVIAGNRSYNPLLSRYLPSPDDGKVSVQSAKVDGMKDFIEIASSHTFIMNNEQAVMQTIVFLREGMFRHEAP